MFPAVLFDLDLLLPLFLQLSLPQFLVFFVEIVDFLAVLHVPIPSIAFLFLFLPDRLFCLQFEQLSFLHVFLVLVNVLLLDLLVLFTQILLELLQLLLLLLLALMLLLLAFLYLVLSEGSSTIVS